MAPVRGAAGRVAGRAAVAAERGATGRGRRPVARAASGGEGDDNGDWATTAAVMAAVVVVVAKRQAAAM